MIAAVSTLLSRDVQSQNSPAPVKDLGLANYTIRVGYAATPKPVEPRQDKETWQAFEKLDL